MASSLVYRYVDDATGRCDAAFVAIEFYIGVCVGGGITGIVDQRPVLSLDFDGQIHLSFIVLFRGWMTWNHLNAEREVYWAKH